MDNTQVDPKANEQQPSPAENDIALGEDEQGGDQPTPERLEWDKLTGSVKARVRKLVQERNQLREQVETSRTPEPTPSTFQPQPTAPVVPPTMQPYLEDQGAMTDEQKLAVNKLRNKYGFVTQEDIEAERSFILGQVQKAQDEQTVDTEHGRLEDKYDGTDGRPAYDRREIEQYMREMGIYNPEAAYRELYYDEIVDWEVSRRGKGAKSETKQTYSVRPTGSSVSREQPLSVDFVRARLREPDGRQWWEDNREKILPQLPELMKTT